MNPDFKKFTYDLIIKERHLDTFGHVNNAAYLEILEEARWEMTHQSGFGIAQIIEHKLGPTILEVTLQFKKEIKLRDEIQISTFVERYEGKICELLQEIRNKKTGDLLSVARFKIGLFDLVKRRLIDPTPLWLEVIGAMKHSS